MATVDAGQDQRALRMRERVFIGGVGAFVPATLTYSVSDYVEFFYYPDPFLYLFALRLAGLFAIGGFWVYLHRTENNPLKVFQLGIVAPAILVGIVSANLSTAEPSNRAPGNQAPPQTGQPPVSGWSLVSPAYAQPAAPRRASPASPATPATPAVAKVTAANVSRYVGKKRWDWTVYVTADSAVLKRIRCVEYTLHPTFKPQVRRVCGAAGRRYPFGLSTNGWGTFNVGIKVEFADNTTLALDHMLAFTEPDAGNSFLRGVFGLKK